MNKDLPVYAKWEDIPEGIATKTTLSRDHGLKLTKDQKPVALKMAFNHRGKHVGYYDLYSVQEAVPKKAATPAQLAALEKARHMAEKLTVFCSECKREQYGRYGAYVVTRKQWVENDYDHYVCDRCTDKHEAYEWAVNLLDYGDFLILDTETTDLYGEIIEIAVINAAGDVLLNQRIKPVGDITPGAQAVHGISMDDLKDAPCFTDVYPTLKQILTGQVVIIYNRSYDTACIRQDCERRELKPIRFDAACAMEWYAQWYGEWSEYHGNYRWQPLGGGHSALSDCKATLAVLKEMAQVENETA